MLKLILENHRFAQNVVLLDLSTVNDCKELDQISLGGLWSKKQWEHEISNPDHISIGIKKNKKLLAIASGSVVIDELNITFVAVHPKFRRKGLGGLLLAKLFIHALSEGAKTATLEVSSANSAAIAFYKSYGFKTLGSRDNYYRDGTDALIQSCFLTEQLKGYQQTSKISVDYRHKTQ